MRRAALAAAFLGLIGTGIGCRATFACNDCANDPSCGPLPAYANPHTIAGPTQTGATLVTPVPVPVAPPLVITPTAGDAALPELPNIPPAGK